MFYIRLENERPVEEEVEEKAVPLDLGLFGSEDLMTMKKRYNLEFFIFCSTEVKTVNNICNRFRRVNNLV